MLKQRIVKLVIALAVVATLAGASGAAAESLGLPVVSPAYACDNSGHSGGGC